MVCLREAEGPLWWLRVLGMRRREDGDPGHGRPENLEKVSGRF